jgi:hypothetical protein
VLGFVHTLEGHEHSDEAYRGDEIHQQLVLVDEQWRENEVVDEENDEVEGKNGPYMEYLIPLEHQP